MQAVTDCVAVNVEVPRKIWTREEAHALVDLGFPNAEKLELIYGDLIDRMGKKHPHVLWQHLAAEWLRRVFGPDYVRSESPTDVAREDNLHSEPEPDLMVTKRSIREYTANPAPEELRLVIEISDSTLQFDLQVKSNLCDKQLIVHRNPTNGLYTHVMTYQSDEEVRPLATPNASFCMDRL